MTNDMVKFAMKPSGWVVFFRTFFPYQVYRFFWVNGRMLTMIWKSHSHGGNPAALELPAKAAVPASRGREATSALSVTSLPVALFPLVTPSIQAQVVGPLPQMIVLPRPKGPVA